MRLPPARFFLPVLAAALPLSCAAPPAADATLQHAPGKVVTSSATSSDIPGTDNPIPLELRGRAGNAGYIPPEPRETPPPPITRNPPRQDFNAVAFETEGSPPGIRAQYEAAARAYRQAAAQSPSPQREQYLEAAAQLDRQAEALITR